VAFFLSLDQGTTSSRAIVFDEAGAAFGMAQKPLHQSYPQPGWVEHDAVEIWTSQLECARAALINAKLSHRDIAAVGIANQRETTILWDRASGQPLHPALVWQDRRGAAWCELQVERGLLPAVRSSTGLVLDPYFSASKIAWLLDHVPGARLRAERGELAFGTVDSWLLWQLTDGKVFATDPSNASRTLLYNIHAGCWDDALLAAFDIPAALLPEVRPSSGIFGSTAARFFGGEIPIAGIAGDQQAALCGQGCYGPGQVKNTYGTGCFMLMHTGQSAIASAHGLLTTAAAQVGAARGYAIEGSVFSAGSAVQWLRDELRIIDHAADIEGLAASVPDSAGVMFVPAFNGLGSPYWDAFARGTIVGITRGTGRAHLARAVLDAIALQSAELLDAMVADTGLALDELRADGGASANAVLMQLQADLMGIPVVVPRVAETTALGVADLAALALGIWADPTALSAARREKAGERIYTPAASRDWAQNRRAEWRRAVQRSLDWSRLPSAS